MTAGLVLVVLGLALVVVLVAMTTTSTHRRTALTSGSGDARAILLDRFVDRSLRFRRAGALVGVVLMGLALVVASMLDGPSGGVHLDLIPLASIGLAGSIVGSIVAEAFRLRRPGGTRTATLEVRDRSDYADAVSDQRERVVLGLALVGVVGAAATGAATLQTAALAGAVALLAVVRRWSISRVALRPRPPLPDDLRDADDEVRRLAASAGLSRPIVTLSALATAALWGAMRADSTWGSGVRTAFEATVFVVSVGLFAAAARWWWTNRSFGLSPEAGGEAARRRSHLTGWVVATLVAVLAMTMLLVLARGA